MKYIIHLKLEDSDPDPKAKRAEKEAHFSALQERARIEFVRTVRETFRSKELVILNEPYTGQTFTIGIFVNIDDNVRDSVVDTLRGFGTIDTIEVEFEPWPEAEKPPTPKKKDLSRFLK